MLNRNYVESTLKHAQRAMAAGQFHHTVRFLQIAQFHTAYAIAQLLEQGRIEELQTAHEYNNFVVGCFAAFAYAVQP